MNIAHHVPDLFACDRGNGQPCQNIASDTAERCINCGRETRDAVAKWCGQPGCDDVAFIKAFRPVLLPPDVPDFPMV